MASRTVGAPDPRKPVGLRDRRYFQTFASHATAESRKAMAMSHTYGRNPRMFELFCGLSTLASIAKHGSSVFSRLRGISFATVSCTDAVVQKFTCQKPNAAAHFAPGQIRLNGLTPWEYLHNQTARFFFMDLFADAQKLHVNFNKADEAIEEGVDGLKELAANCSYILTHDPNPSKDNRANRTLVHNIYDQLWLPGLQKSINVAIETKERKPQPPQVAYDPNPWDPHLITNLQDIGEAGDYEWNIEDTLRILGDYKQYAVSTIGPTAISETFHRIEACLKAP